VEPFEGVKFIRGMLITRAKGWVGWAKSASECTGWRCGFGLGMAELPEQKVHLGRGPRWVVVSWVAMRLRKMEGGKYWGVGGGSCWTVVRGVNGKVWSDLGFCWQVGRAYCCPHCS
jgi:hypothetical protein